MASAIWQDARAAGPTLGSPAILTSHLSIAVYRAPSQHCQLTWSLLSAEIRGLFEINLDRSVNHIGSSCVGNLRPIASNQKRAANSLPRPCAPLKPTSSIILAAEQGGSRPSSRKSGLWCWHAWGSSGSSRPCPEWRRPPYRAWPRFSGLEKIAKFDPCDETTAAPPGALQLPAFCIEARNGV